MRSVSIGLAVAGLALVACNRDRSGDGTAVRDPNEQDQAGSATLTGASYVSNESAIDRIVAARCAREVTCSNLGPDRRYPTGDNCIREVRHKLVDEMKPSECPHGIDGKELDECLDAIRNESCTNALDTIARLTHCRTSQLCLK
ncbi:MAG: hypothetical protein KIT84_12470 [Labilithrix sp.]|nr:hypothetical protein [Labilithrix sp.]MCW5811828.1 hypothetical protein [Labilithrix sp.]